MIIRLAKNVAAALFLAMVTGALIFVALAYYSEWRRASVIQGLKETRTGAKKRVALHEREELRLLLEFIERDRDYEQGLITRSEALRAGHEFDAAVERGAEDNRWLAKTDAAIKDAEQRGGALRWMFGCSLNQD